MATLTAVMITTLVDAQLKEVSDETVRSLIQSHRVAPRCEPRPWDYAESNQTYPCWIVLEHRDVAVAYCEQGFGPRNPWGLLWIAGARLSMGMDSGWFNSLEDAARDLFTNEIEAQKR